MKFQLKASSTQAELDDYVNCTRFMKEKKQYSWFAWRPVYCVDINSYVWFEDIFAYFKYEYIPGRDFPPHWRKSWTYNFKCRLELERE